MKKSAMLLAEDAFVEQELADRIICDKCRATLKTYAMACTAELSDPCQGFQAIEAAKSQFRKERTK